VGTVTGDWTGSTLTVPTGTPSGSILLIAYGNNQSDSFTNPSGFSPSITRTLSPSFNVVFGLTLHDGRSTYEWAGATSIVGSYVFVTDPDTSRIDYNDDEPGQIGNFFLIEGVPGDDLSSWDADLSGTIASDTVAWQTGWGFLPAENPLRAVRAYVSVSALSTLVVSMSVTEESGSVTPLANPSRFQLLPAVTEPNEASAPFPSGINDASWYSYGWIVQGSRRVQQRVRQRQIDNLRARQHESRQQTRRGRSYI